MTPRLSKWCRPCQNIPVLSNFLSPAGMIKPRRMTGLCAKCQRKVAKAIKRSRHMGIIPHTAGIQVGRLLREVAQPLVLLLIVCPPSFTATDIQAGGGARGRRWACNSHLYPRYQAVHATSTISPLCYHMTEPRTVMTNPPNAN